MLPTLFPGFIDSFGKPGADFSDTFTQLALAFLYLAIGAFLASCLQVSSAQVACIPPIGWRGSSDLTTCHNVAWP